MAQANWNDAAKSRSADGVDAVGDDAGEAEIAGEQRHVDRVARPGDGAGPERERIGFGPGAREPLVIAPQCRHMREEEVRDEHRLSRRGSA